MISWLFGAGFMEKLKITQKFNWRKGNLPAQPLSFGVPQPIGSLGKHTLSTGTVFCDLLDMIWHHDYGISHISASAKVSSICRHCYQRHTECSQILRRMTFFRYKLFHGRWNAYLFLTLLIRFECLSISLNYFREFLLNENALFRRPTLTKSKEKLTLLPLRSHKKLCYEENEKNGKSNTHQEEDWNKKKRSMLHLTQNHRDKWIYSFI